MPKFKFYLSYNEIHCFSAFVEVEAKDKDTARRLAEESISDLDFGEPDDIDYESSYVEDTSAVCGDQEPSSTHFIDAEGNIKRL